MRALLATLTLCVGLIVTAGSASAESPVPWRFTQVQTSLLNTNHYFATLRLIAHCPPGYTPVSGGIEMPESSDGTGQYSGVLNEYATFWDGSFSASVETDEYGATFTLIADCALTNQIGAVQVVSADFAPGSNERAGGWVACPAGTGVIGGGEDWNVVDPLGQVQEYAAPSNDGSSWYATGETAAGGDSLHVEAYCVGSAELTGERLVVEPYPRPTGFLEADCPPETRLLDGGLYAALSGEPVEPGQDAGEEQYSAPAGISGWRALPPLDPPTGTTVYVTAWCVPASIPTVSITSAPPTVSGQPYANFTFATADPAGYPLSYTCILDGSAAGCDSSTGTGYDPLTDGPHTFTVSVSNPEGQLAHATYQWRVDTIAPTVSATAPTQPFTLAASTTVSWNGEDGTDGSGIASYQVRERTAPYNGAFTAWTYPASWQALSSSTTSVTASGLSQGVDYCFAVGATDQAGNTSTWSAQRCTARPLDDRALTLGTGWTRGTGANYWYQTISTTSTSAATATRSGAELDRVGIVATRGPGMGTVAVYAGATQLEQINLSSPTTHYRALILLPPFSYRTATVQLKVVSQGKPVQIDGLGTSRS